MTKNMGDGKCVYGEETRKMVKELNEAVKDLRNHYSKRLPTWAVFFITFLSSLASSLVVWGVAT
ncbi:MAG: hypothetical protein ACOC5T_02385 [Elusimicrobiota bacterium]